MDSHNLTIDVPSRTEQEKDLEEIFRLIREHEGIDLSNYRRNTIERRVMSRLQKLNYNNFHNYAVHLAEDPTESRRLLEHIAIKVSCFFRDAPFFAQLRESVLPDLMTKSNIEGELRIWSAGCGNGEEAYSLAILIDELQRRGQSMPRVTILGTDFDKGALEVARRGLYPECALEKISPELINAYFVCQDGRFAPNYDVIPRLKSAVTFADHDLLSASTAPDGLRFHLVLCRNVLIYFKREAQRRVFGLLGESVIAGGYLCLGEAEQLPNEYNLHFETIDRQNRLYRKIEPA